MWLLSACAFIGPVREAERLDPDHDSVAWPWDCDDHDASVLECAESELPSPYLTGAADEGLGTALDYADWNGDGGPDLVVASAMSKSGGNVVAVYLSPFEIGAPPGVSMVAGGLGRAVVAGDLDADGLLDDLLVSRQGASTRAVFGDWDSFSEVDFYDGREDDCGAALEIAELDGHPPNEAVVGCPLGARVEVLSVDLLSSVDSSEIVATIEGPEGSGTGEVLDGAGDLDGDGVDDLLVGAPGAGDVRVFLGPVSGTLSSTDSSATLHLACQPGAEGEFPLAVAALGDMDDDGYGELGAAYVNCSSQGGGVSVVSYTPGRFGEVGRLVPTGPDQNDGFGRTLERAGDRDDDGREDVLIGAPDRAGRGAVFVAFGPVDGTVSPILLVTGDEADGALGRALAGGGRLAGDVHADVAIAGAGTDGGGAVYLLSGVP